MADFILTKIEQKIIQQFHVWGLPRTPGSRIVQSDGWFQVISEDYKSAAFNEVLFHHCLDSEIERRIVDTIELYQELKTDFKWCIQPSSAPEHTADLLRKHEFQNWQSRMMYVRVAEYILSPLAEHMTVHKVEFAEMDVFLELFMRCWKIDPKEYELMKMQLLFDHQQSSACFERFLAFVDGQYAGVASMVRNEDCGYLHATAVLPEFQGRGVYRALVEKRIEILKDAKVPLAITGAREHTSAPRLEKMGFNTAWQLQMFLKKHQA